MKSNLPTLNGSTCNSLAEVWQSNSPSFVQIQVEQGKPYIKAALMSEVLKMVEILKADMQEIHCKFFVDYILDNYNSYNVNDIKFLTKKLAQNNPYGKPILQNLIFELDQYSIERSEVAVEYRIKESGEHKQIQSDDFAKMYERLKVKSKPPKSQKEKDADAIARNDEKIEQMKREGWKF